MVSAHYQVVICWNRWRLSTNKIVNI